jgi:hypothetical protein
MQVRAEGGFVYRLGPCLAVSSAVYHVFPAQFVVAVVSVPLL